MTAPSKSRERTALLLVLSGHIAACCLSLIYVLENYEYVGIFAFERTQLDLAFLSVSPLIAVGVIFAFSRFSVGYFVGFGFYTIVLGYAWLSRFSLLQYDHWLGSISALLALLTFLAPALFITSPIKQRAILSDAAVRRLLSVILVLGTVVGGVGVLYNFRIVDIDDIYKFRTTLDFPAPLRYAIGVFSAALLPFAFACDYMLGNRLRAAAALFLLLLFYPITLTKLALFSPFWLLILALLSKRFEARMVVMLSLFPAILLGVVLVWLAKLGLISMDDVVEYFGPINFRMIAVPSIALDLYSDFFTKHDLTFFCQISFAKLLASCPYQEPLAIIMSKNYPLGFVNASLFATEGVASVGLKWAPLSTFACGLVIALANRLSSGLPSRFILLSAGLLFQVLLNVPLSTSLLSSGAAVLFALWYVTPRGMFEKGSGIQPVGPIEPSS